MTILTTIRVTNSFMEQKSIFLCKRNVILFTYIILGKNKFESSERKLATKKIYLCCHIYNKGKGILS